MARVLVTGGAGYVGSVCAAAARRAGHDVTVLDSLELGHREAVSGPLIVADLRDRADVDRALALGFDAVMHFAARSRVGESVSDPVGYHDVNVGGTLTLLEAMHRHGVSRLVFSSTCAIFGVPARVPIDEDVPVAPISPYGESKALVERLLAHAAATRGLRAASLRYFNAAGASEDGQLGECHEPETHLIPLALRARTSGVPLTVFGDAHPTPDGTCVRDYIHVEDLADAHVRALARLLDGGSGGAWNLGTEHGNSVAEVLSTIARITGGDVPHTVGPARAGDPPVLIADARRAATDLGWTATRSLDQIVADAWRWHTTPAWRPATGH